MPVNTVLFDRHTEHLRRRRAIDIAAAFKHTLPPLLSGDPSDDTGFDRREIGNVESTARSRDKGGADQFGQHHRHGIVQQIDRFIAAATDERTSLTQIGQMVLRQILHLDKPPGISAGPVRAVELNQSAGAVIRSNSGFHRRILFDAALGELLSE